MKRPLMRQLAFLFLVGSLAAPPAPCRAEHTPGTVEGAWALQFRIGNNFSLSSFSGSLLSVQHQYSTNSALRFGLTTDMRSLDLEDRYVSGDTIDVTTTGDQKDRSFGVVFQYLRYSTPGKRISMYWAAGPEVEYRKNSFPSSSQKSGFVGARGSLGAEWSPISEVGLHAEYGLRGGYLYTRFSASGTGQRTARREGWEVASQGVWFGLSAYF